MGVQTLLRVHAPWSIWRTGYSHRSSFSLEGVCLFHLLPEGKAPMSPHHGASGEGHLSPPGACPRRSGHLLTSPLFVLTFILPCRFFQERLCAHIT
jgi:hypothetical protein